MVGRDVTPDHDVQHSALTKKGLRRSRCRHPADPRDVQHSALTKKGLRRKLNRKLRNLVNRSALCPDEEGIKTSRRRHQPTHWWQRSALCPDEEGIKTPGEGSEKR